MVTDPVNAKSLRPSLPATLALTMRECGLGLGLAKNTGITMFLFFLPYSQFPLENTGHSYTFPGLLQYRKFHSRCISLLLAEPQTSADIPRNWSVVLTLPKADTL